jgi:hypothetical protein
VKHQVFKQSSTISTAPDPSQQAAAERRFHLRYLGTPAMGPNMGLSYLASAFLMLLSGRLPPICVFQFLASDTLRSTANPWCDGVSYSPGLSHTVTLKAH